MKSLFGQTLLFLPLLYSFTATAQNTSYTDSVKKVAASQMPDTNKLNSFFTLSLSYQQYCPDSSLAYAVKALNLAEKLNIDGAIFGADIMVSQALMIAGNYPLELEYCFKAVSQAKRLNNQEAVAYCNIMLSDCYYNLGEYRTSIDYLRGLINFGNKSCPGEVYHLFINFSRIYEGMGYADSSLLYAKKAYQRMKLNPELTKENFTTKVEFSCIATLLGNAFAANANYDSALFYYRTGLPVAIDAYRETDKIDDYNGIAAIFKASGNIDSAAWYAGKIIREKVTKTYPVGLLKAVNMLASIYELKHKPDSTLKYVRIAFGLKDSLFNREKMLAIQNITYKEQEKQKTLEASGLRLQNQYKMYALLAGFIAILIIAAVLFRNNRQKQLQNMRNSIADDLHDDIGSTLSSISIMSELAKQKSPEAIPLLACIGENTLTIQENMSDIVWAVNSKNDRFENVTQRMNQFAAEILDAKNIELEFKSDASLSAPKLTMGQRKNFYLFFKEAVNNAAKYSDAKKVSVCIYQKDNHIEMTIRDDGKGFDAAGIFNGNGMTTLRKRGNELNAQFNITSHIKEGTAVQLKFKIT